MRAYLTRKRRDKRFDRTITAAIRDGKPIPTDMVTTARRLFIAGSDPHHRMGLLQIDAFQILDAGASAATEIAGQIAAWFPCDLPLFQEGIRIRVTKAPDIAGALSDDTHWMVPVTVSYEAFA
ncbi:phage tail terminator-like protein [Mesorhizobium sp. M1405]|uniref:phage tail terminator-like protein n=1 Tax=unclassified Mesorhizobium TaxID=325217 RepID=UPI003336C17F